MCALFRRRRFSKMFWLRPIAEVCDSKCLWRFALSISSVVVVPERLELNYLRT